ncbi:MAG: hypothetical protein U0L47_09295 [Paludibacteraceae bacterium]|nr:hypothetical protein [Paludibacteraceae bacterium]
MMVSLLNGINKVMQLDLFAMFAEAESRPKVQPVTKPVRKVQPCSLAEFRASQEIEHDFFSGRAAWLYKQLDSALKRQEAQRLEESRVLASGWR